MKVLFLLAALALCLGLAPRPTAAQVLPHTFAAGYNHSLAIHADGTLWATGNNLDGQLGNGTTANSAAWVQVGTATNWVQVAVGNYHSLGLRADGTLWSWGLNLAGQLGTATNAGTGAPTPTPVRVGTALYTQVAAGANFSLGLRADGSLYGWGTNGYGELGTGTTSAPTSTPMRVGTATYTQVAAGQYHSLALRADGSLWAWGTNRDGQLGNATNYGTYNTNPTPARVGTATYTQVTAGVYHSLGLRTDGTLWAWGGNTYGQLGTGSASQYSTTPAQVGTGLYTQVAAGGAHNLGLRADGSLWVWGINMSGQLGTGAAGANVSTPVRVGTATYAQAQGGDTHTLALRADGSLWAWGSNKGGQLGTATNAGTTTSNPTPLATGTALPTRSTATGGSFGLAVKADGTLWAWGDNTYGQLGDGGTTASLPPRQVGSARDWVQVAAGLRHALALKADGTLWAWGSNTYGQLGTAAGSGTTTATRLPVRVGTALYTQVAAGSNYTLALQVDGSAWAWGYNYNGQLGTATNAGTSAPTPTPTRVGSASHTRLAAGGGHSLGRQANGTLWAWGDNTYGQLGIGGTSATTTPRQVGAATYVQAAAGNYHSLALRADGSLYAWGFNYSGQLGNALHNNTLVASPTPIRVGAATYTQVAAGSLHSLGLQADGSLWAWGSNSYGQLGTGSSATTANPTPTREATASTAWVTLATGPASYASLVRTASGLSFASAGSNSAGQLGDGTSTDWPRFDRANPLQSLHLLPVRPTGAASGLALFPNPSQGRATTLSGAAPGAVVQVLDALGRVVATTTADASGTAALELPAALAPGVYLVQASGQVRRLAVE